MKWDPDKNIIVKQFLNYARMRSSKGKFEVSFTKFKSWKSRLKSFKAFNFLSLGNGRYAFKSFQN